MVLDPFRHVEYKDTSSGSSRICRDDHPDGEETSCQQMTFIQHDKTPTVVQRSDSVNKHTVQSGDGKKVSTSSMMEIKPVRRQQVPHEIRKCSKDRKLGRKCEAKIPDKISAQGCCVTLYALDPSSQFLCRGPAGLRSLRRPCPNRSSGTAAALPKAGNA